MTTSVSFTVNKDFVLPKVFETLSPKDVGLLITVAGRLHELFLNEYKNTNQKITESKMDGVNQTIEKILEEARKIEKTKNEHEISSLRKKNEDLQEQLVALKISLEGKRVEFDMMKESGVNSRELLNSKEYEQRGYQRGYEEGKERSADDVLELKEKKNKVYEYQTKIQELQDKLLNVEENKNQTITKLKDEISKLNTPMAKGESGEYVVEDTLKNARFHVFDTSKTPYKEQGYLDRLITEDGNFPSNGWTIAIEVKNKKRIVKSTDIDVFKKKCEVGILEGKFNGAILLSIDDSLGPDNATVEFVNDEAGIPLAPIALYSPVASTNSLTQEQVILCVQQHINIMKQCNSFRSLLFNQSAKDEDVKKIQLFFKNYVKETKENFEEFGEITKTLQKTCVLLEKKKKKMFEQFKNMEHINNTVSWLTTSFDIPLNIVYENAKSKFETNKSNSKSQIFSKISNVPLLHNQLGTDNAWDIIKTINPDNSAMLNDISMEEEPSNNNVENGEEESDDTNLLDICKKVLEHVQAKKKTRTDFDLASVTLATLNPKLRDEVRFIGGVDVIKRYINTNTEKFTVVKDEHKDKKPRTS